MDDFKQANDSQPATRNDTALLSLGTAQARAIQEVQASMIIAQRFPRDRQRALQNIKSDCQNIELARQATYSFPKGGANVEGPSIRLAECLAQHWGNMVTGIRELTHDEENHESLMETLAWDLETNNRDFKQFTVKHRRKARGSYSVLTDDREVYEMTANLSARRKRACILAVIPKWVQDEAVQECEKTLLKGAGEPLQARIAKVMPAFEQFRVTQKQIEERCGKKLDALNEQNLVSLMKIWNSLNDGMSKPDQWFAAEQPQGESQKPSGADTFVGAEDFDKPAAEAPPPASTTASQAPASIPQGQNVEDNDLMAPPPDDTPPGSTTPELQKCGGCKGDFPQDMLTRRPGGGPATRLCPNCLTIFNKNRGAAGTKSILPTKTTSSDDSPEPTSESNSTPSLPDNTLDDFMIANNIDSKDDDWRKQHIACFQLAQKTPAETIAHIRETLEITNVSELDLAGLNKLYDLLKAEKGE